MFAFAYDAAGTLTEPRPHEQRIDGVDGVDDSRRFASADFRDASDEIRRPRVPVPDARLLGCRRGRT